MENHALFFCTILGDGRHGGHACCLSGPIFVKGKGIITTYFVTTPFDKGSKQSNGVVTK